MKRTRKGVIREMVCFEYHVLHLDLVGSKVNKFVSRWAKADLETTCDQTLWMGLVGPTKEHSWSLIRELLN